MTKHRLYSYSRGFTLIELSIVLVIIGLLTAGILVGRDLIRAAEIRATIGQVESFNSAVNTFRGKYGYIPGDMPSAQASAFGFFSESGGTEGTQGNGDGNGRIEAGNTGYSRGLGEILIFWRHLSEAGLIKGSYGMSGNSAITAAGMLTGDVSNIGQSLPPSKIAGGFFVAYWHEWSWPGNYPNVNYFELQGVTGIGAAAGQPGANPLLTPADAYAIDSKLDNGMPNTGKVTTRSILSGDSWDNIPSNIGPAKCQSGTPPTDFFLVTSTYNVGGVTGNTPLCALSFQFQ